MCSSDGNQHGLRGAGQPQPSAGNRAVVPCKQLGPGVCGANDGRVPGAARCEAVPPQCLRWLISVRLPYIPVDGLMLSVRLGCERGLEGTVSVRRWQLDSTRRRQGAVQSGFASAFWRQAELHGGALRQACLTDTRTVIAGPHLDGPSVYHLLEHYRCNVTAVCPAHKGVARGGMTWNIPNRVLLARCAAHVPEYHAQRQHSDANLQSVV